MAGYNVNYALVRVFVILQMVGCFAFTFMIFSAIIFPSVKRHPVWYNFCLSWVVFGLSYSLLSFAGQQYTVATSSLCAAQAAMVYAAPFIAGGCTVALVIQLLSSILSALSRSSLRKSHPVLTTLSIVVPWVIWSALLAGVIVFVVKNPNQVQRSHNGTFCVVVRSPIPRLTSVSAAFFSITVLSLEGAIGYLLYRHRALKDIVRQSIAMAMQVFIFTGVALTGAVIGLIFASTKKRGVVLDVMIAIVPVSTAIIFGSQTDLWEGYIFWRRSTSHTYASRVSTHIATMTIPTIPTISIRRRSTISTIESVPRPPSPAPLTSIGTNELRV